MKSKLPFLFFYDLSVDIIFSPSGPFD